MSVANPGNNICINQGTIVFVSLGKLPVRQTPEVCIWDGGVLKAAQELVYVFLWFAEKSFRVGRLLCRFSEADQRCP